MIGEIEKKLQKQGSTGLLIGVDEAGRGPLAGPVVAAAVCLPWDHELRTLDDSKKLSEKVRNRLYDRIKAEAVGYRIFASGPQYIDQHNIRQATLRAMRECVGALAQELEDQGHRVSRVVIDGRDTLPVQYTQEAVIKGDARSWNIAAASVLAKVARDRIMRKLADEFPGYGFAKHKGYPTAAHRKAIQELGPCPQHRMTFKGVSEYVRNTAGAG